MLEANNFHRNNLLQLILRALILESTESNRSSEQIPLNWLEVHSSCFSIDRCVQFQLSSSLTASIFKARLKVLRKYPTDTESGVFGGCRRKRNFVHRAHS